VADAYKIDTDKQRQFRPHSAQPFDDRIGLGQFRRQIAVMAL
jgi:hypothetical protein